MPAIAPGALATLQAFINTLDVEERREELADPTALRNWLVAHDLLAGGAPLTEEDLQAARTLRESFRALLELHDGGAPAPAAVAALNELSAGAPLRVRFDENGDGTLVPAAGGIAEAVGRLLAIALAAMLDGTWERLKVCRSGTCRWAFYDVSKNRSRHWCSMSVCGNRSKVRSYQQRRRT